MPIDQLAVVADRVLETTPFTSQIAASSVSSDAVATTSSTSELYKLISQLTERVEKLANEMHDRSNS